MKMNTGKPWLPQHPVWRKEELMRRAAIKAGTMFGEIWVEGTDITYYGERYSLIGATATVEELGELKRRITVSRAFWAGPFALLAPKKISDRELVLTVDHPDYQFVAPLDPKRGFEAKQFASRLNSIARKSVSA